MTDAGATANDGGPPDENGDADDLVVPSDTAEIEIESKPGSTTSILIEGDSPRTRIVRHGVVHAQAFEGPIPPPELLQQYDDVHDGLAERIVSMAERQSAHRQRLEHAVIVGGARRATQGLWLGFTISVIVIAAGLWMVLSDHDNAGITLISIDLATLAGVFVFGRVDQRRERVQKARQIEGEEPQLETPDIEAP